MNLSKIAVAAAVLGLCAGTAWAQLSERPKLPFEDQPGPERLGTNSFGGLRPVPGIHSEQPMTPDIDDLLPNLPQRYYLTIRYYAVNPWFINPYTGNKLQPHEILRSVQTTNPDWPGRNMPLEDLLKEDSSTGEPLVEISGLMDDNGNEMVIDENNEEAMQDWLDDQMAEAENADDARRAAEASQIELSIPDIKAKPIWHAPFYGLYCLKIRICIPVFASTPRKSVYQYWVRWPYKRFQPWCWSRWWWYRWNTVNNVTRIYPWRPLCIPRAVWHRVGPNWVWNVTNVNTYRRWCLYGLRYYFTPFANRFQALPRIAGLNSALSPVGGWIRPWPYPRVRYWPFRSYCTRWYWFRCIPWLTYRYSPPVIQAAFAVPKPQFGAGFADLPDEVQAQLDDMNKPVFPPGPPNVDPNSGYDHGDADERFAQFFDTDVLCTARPQESPLGDNDGNGFVTRSDVPRNILLERLEDTNQDTEDTDGSTNPQ